MKQLTASAQSLLKPLVAFTKIKPGDKTAITELEKALKMLPATQVLAHAIDELRENAQALVDKASHERASAFGRIEATYLKAAAAEQKPVREQGNGWRVGILELEVRRDQAQARFLYNHEDLTGWSPVSSAEELQETENAAIATLQKAALPEQLLIHVFWDAFILGRDRRRREGATNFERIPVLDFYRQVRAAMVLHELAEQKPDKRLTAIEMPCWAFLHNLDRYRQMGSAIPQERRLAFVIGSQEEVRQGRCLLVGGHNIDMGYKNMAYVEVAKRPTA